MHCEVQSISHRVLFEGDVTNIEVSGSVAFAKAEAHVHAVASQCLSASTVKRPLASVSADGFARFPSLMLGTNLLPRTTRI